MKTIPFRTRARTIDHLGREQIADCPTAISELWKNAYDAYARTVALHIFDGEEPVAAIVDDGHGMSYAEFVDRWLTVGTESKVDGVAVPESDRNGLPERVRQGQKGIGRLSVARLGSMVLVLSKRRGEPFLASLIDWRIFENPYLVLEDVGIPVETFESPGDLPDLVSGMFNGLVDNVWGNDGDPERNRRVTDAWKRYDEQEKGVELPSERIAGTALAAQLEPRHLAVWPVWTGEAEHGTALFLFSIARELDIWVELGVSNEDAERIDIATRLHQSLLAYVDPYKEEAALFNYGMTVHLGDGESVRIDGSETFGLDQADNLEHLVQGRVDEYGLFTGSVRAFGVERGEIELVIAKNVLDLKGKGRVGPFDVYLGTFEVERKNSTLTDDQHASLTEQAAKFSGLTVYRDDLRVLPYGRADSDFFEMEIRRSTHAGREFWSHRRTFGRIAISRRHNPNLRDKAGREGLIDDRALRAFRFLVMDLLKTLARRFFGYDSEVRKEDLPDIQKRNKAAATKAQKRSVKAFRSKLKRQRPEIEACRVATADLRRRIEEAHGGAEESLTLLAEEITRIKESKRDQRPPVKPARLKSEASYRDYRDSYNALRAELEDLEEAWDRLLEDLGPIDPESIAKSALGRHQQSLNDKLTRWQSEIEGIIGGELKKLKQLKQSTKEDRSVYFRRAVLVIGDLAEQRVGLDLALKQLEKLYYELEEEFSFKYEPKLDTLQQIQEDIDLASARTWESDRRVVLEKEVERFRGLAQLGIAVEILGHELHHLDSEVTRNLGRLSSSARESAAYKRARWAHDALAAQLSFLSQLKLSGRRLREEITGDEIARYMERFFRNQLEHAHTSLDATDEFRRLAITELKSRIYPVFINLINNSLYWIRQVEERRIILDRVEDRVVVADTGPGVDPDDVDQLFTLFFSRKIEGRGVGLYLCKSNLEAEGHRIEYVVDGSDKLLSGANFVIHFKKVDNV